MFIIEFFNVELVLGSLDELGVLLEEGRPVDKITYSETKSKNLGGVGWANTLEGGSNGLVSLSQLSHSIGFAVDVGDEGGSVTHKQSP